MAWYDPNWGYRVPITIDNTQVGSDLTDFPIYGRGSDFPTSLFTNAKSDGSDFRLTRSDGTTECPFEIVSYDSVAETFELHVKANFISSTSDTTFYLYYGYASASAYGVADTYGRNAVWSDYDMVFHMNDSDPSTSVVDATGNGFDLTDTGMSISDAVTGKLTGGIQFSPTKHLQYTEGSAVVPESYPLTIQGWWKPTNVSNSARLYWVGKTSTAFQHIVGIGVDYCAMGHHIYGSGSGTYRSVDTAASTVSSGSWYMFHHVFAGTSSRINYLNGGAEKVTGTDTTNTIEQHNGFAIGRFIDSSPAAGTDDWVGSEYRVRSSSLSDDWISAEYTNQNSPTTFYTIGSEESAPASDTWLPTITII